LGKAAGKKKPPLQIKHPQKALKAPYVKKQGWLPKRGKSPGKLTGGKRTNWKFFLKRKGFKKGEGTPPRGKPFSVGNQAPPGGNYKPENHKLKGLGTGNQNCPKKDWARERTKTWGGKRKGKLKGQGG